METPQTPAAVVNVQPSGDYITRPEFVATIGPMASDITEMKGDVKLLLARDAGSRAVTGLLGKVGTVTTTLVAGSIGALLTLFIR